MTRVERDREGIEMKGLVRMMTSVRGGSNAKARAELEWMPRYPSWREGFAAELGLVDMKGDDARKPPKSGG